MRVFSGVETPSMEPVWRRVRELRALCSAKPTKPSTATWRKTPATKTRASEQAAARYFRPSGFQRSASARTTPRRSSVGSTVGVARALEQSDHVSEYELLDVLGRGTFGTVKLARHLDSGASVAIKVLAKDMVRELRQEKNILREQTVHLMLDHPFISKLYATFQDNQALYFVLEYCPGGELYSLVYTHDDGHLEEEEDDVDSLNAEGNQEQSQPELQEQEPDAEVSDEVTESTDSESECEHEHAKQSVSVRVSAGHRRSSLEFKQPRDSKPPRSARRKHSMSLANFLAKQTLRSSRGGLHEHYVAFYAACLVSALEYLHDRNILYRDLKLENLVLDVKGYLKLVDFGLSKPDALRNDRFGAAPERHTTMCGSMEYLAPEILQHQAYDQRVDLWAFGIILYELLFGATPFHHENRREQGRRIISEPVRFPDGYEKHHPSVCALIGALLAKDPAQRPASFADVRASNFFRDHFPSPQAWQQLEARQLSPPFVPQLDGPFDTSLFVRVHDEQASESESDCDSDFGY